MRYLILYVFIFSASFIVTLAGTHVLIRKLRFLREVDAEDSRMFFGRDMAKPGDVYIPTMGGIAIALGLVISLLLSLKVIDGDNAADLMAGLITIILIALIGVFDDILIVRRIWRILLPGMAALPLIMVDSDPTKIDIFGYVLEISRFYSYTIILIGVITCANLVNILAGFNGLEAGCGAIACASLFAVSAMLMKMEPYKYSASSSMIALTMCAACLAFLVFNWYPAKIFPGNVGTYTIGAAIASVVIIGDMEKAGVIALTPQVAEFFLKMRGGFRAANFGMLVNGTLKYEGKVYSLTHLFMKYTKVSERRLVGYILGLQAVFGMVAIWSVFWYR
ncbi:MAG: hypothetical protein WC515_08295 [Candidatus Omnitrophota bacterium]